MSSQPTTPSPGAGTRPFPLEPVPVHVPDEVLADLQRRLELTRWPEDAGNRDWYYGVDRAYLQELVDYWRTGYDWRRAEAAITATSTTASRSTAYPCIFCAGPGSARTRPR